MSDQRYNQRGVSASKEDVHNAIKNIDKVSYDLLRDKKTIISHPFKDLEGLFTKFQ